MWSRIRAILWCALVAEVAACAGIPTPPPPQPSVSIPAPASLAEQDPATAAAIDAVLAGEHRLAVNRARDASLHPRDTLLFFGLKPQMSVVEVWPGANGWYTEVLAPLLAGGKLYAAQRSEDPASPYVTAVRASFTSKLAARPDLYGNVTVTSLGADAGDIAPPESCDMVLTFRGLHAWMYLGYAREAFAAMNRALKPGGVLGVVDNRGAPGTTQDPRATNGYVDEEYAIELIESAGFELVARSEINANPNDTKDYEQGVWSLPPDYRQGNRDREKYQAIGESDRFTLKFRKQ
jgi:predicted methyltransferase